MQRLLLKIPLVLLILLGIPAPCLLAENDAEETRPSTDQTAWQPPSPPAAAERVRERQRMVHDQIACPGDRRERVRDEKVLEAMRMAPRHAFVIDRHQRRAYRDTPLPIGHGQTISQPYIVALMTELLDLTPESRVLEIGTGSWY